MKIITKIQLFSYFLLIVGIIALFCAVGMSEHCPDCCSDCATCVGKNPEYDQVNLVYKCDCDFWFVPSCNTATCDYDVDDEGTCTLTRNDTDCTAYKAVNVFGKGYCVQMCSGTVCDKYGGWWEITWPSYDCVQEGGLFNVLHWDCEPDE